MKTKYWLLITFALFLGAALAAPELGTNGVASGTNQISLFDPNEAPSKEGLWKIAIGLLTTFVVWAVSKIPNIPRPFLPAVSPLIGIGVGYGLTFMSTLNLPWWDAGMAGGLGVTIREIFNQWVTKRLQPLEESKTKAKPIDHAVAVSDKTKAGKAELKETGKN